MKPEPEFPRYLFKDLFEVPIDYVNNSKYVIRNIIENGSDANWEKLIDYYGYDKVKDTVVNVIHYMPEWTMERVCEYFQVKPEELFCYRRLQLRMQGIFVP
jgi:hypothetical protein